MNTNLTTVGLLCLCLMSARGADDQTNQRPTRPPSSGRADRFDQGPKPGTAAPDFQLNTPGGQPIHASALWSNKPAVILTGSHTCPIFRGSIEGFEGLARDFGSNVNFVILYTIEAHPKGDPCPYTGKEWVTPANESIGLLIPQPKTMEERTQRARDCIRSLKLTVPVAVDILDNSAWKAYGSAPNSGFLIGRDGNVLEQEGWFNADKMRAAIQKAIAAGPSNQ